MTPEPKFVEHNVEIASMNEVAKKCFERLVGRPHPWEGVQPWVLAAMREAYRLGAASTTQPPAPPTINP